jgi:uncharacterized protein (DUF302 family)
MSDSTSFDVELHVGYEEAVQRVTEALAKEGFGVLTRIDIHSAFKQKIDVDFRPYSILGACNPKLAHKAISARPEAGLMLPCNVTVEAHGDGALVRIADPDEMMKAGGLAGDATLAEVGREARERLERVAAALRAS